MPVIWLWRKPEYFYQRDWTGKWLICPSGAGRYAVRPASHRVVAVASAHMRWRAFNLSENQSAT
jgi:hypothetical protein